MRLMNEILRLFIWQFIMVYADDILVHDHDETSHVEHLYLVFQVLRQQKLYAKLKKYSLFSP